MVPSKNLTITNIIKQDGDKQWYVLRGELKYGPYDYSSMIRMMQDHEILDYNYVWSSHLDQWTLLSELSEFSKDRLAMLTQDTQFMETAFNRRQMARAPIKMAIIAHNDKHVFDGTSLNISAGGGLFLLNDPLLLPQDKLVILFRSNEGVKTDFQFRAKAEIVRKNFSKQRLNVKSGLNYAVRFLEIENPGKDFIDRWINNELKKVSD